MHALYLISLIFLVPITLYPFLQGKHISFMWLGSIFGVATLNGIGTYRSCASGWMSPSIGSSGACSHHGGVVTNVGETGYLILAILTLSSIAAYFFYYNKKEKPTPKGSHAKENHDREKLDNIVVKKRMAKIEDYEKYIPIWHEGGLSIDDIIKHLESTGVSVSRSYIESKIKKIESHCDAIPFTTK